jgi:hypothetical protein
MKRANKVPRWVRRMDLVKAELKMSDSPVRRKRDSAGAPSSERLRRSGQIAYDFGYYGKDWDYLGNRHQAAGDERDLCCYGVFG